MFERIGNLANSLEQVKTDLVEAVEMLNEARAERDSYASKLGTLENAVRATAEAVAACEGVTLGYYLRNVDADLAVVAVINALDPTESQP